MPLTTNEEFEQLIDSVLQGDVQATLDFSTYYRFKCFTQKQLKQIFLKTDSAAEANPGPASNLKGFMNKVPQFAEGWYRHAVEHDNVFAMVNLGQLYIQQKNYLEAKLLLEKAIGKGYAYANFELANLYKNGLGVPKDLTKAEALEKAGLVLLDEGQKEFYFAIPYISEQLTDQMEHLDNAIDLSNIDAMFERAYWYREGINGPVDFTAAIQISKRAYGFEENEIQFKPQLEKLVKLLCDFQKTTLKTLENKEKQDKEQYRDPANSAYWLREKLANAIVQFYVSPTPERLEDLQNKCKVEMDIARSWLEVHRGLWFQIDPIFRAILGVLATITVIPAVAVALTSGYVRTFFSTPETDSVIALKEFETTFCAVEDELQIAMTPS